MLNSGGCAPDSHQLADQCVLGQDGPTDADNSLGLHSGVYRDLRPARRAQNVCTSSDQVRPNGYEGVSALRSIYFRLKRITRPAWRVPMSVSMRRRYSPVASVASGSAR